MSKDFEKFASALREANRQGPPQETCKVLDGGKLRRFNSAEDELIGGHLVEGAKITDEPFEMPLYGNDDKGWKLRY